MSYRGRSCKRLRRTLLRKSVEKGLLQEVSRGRSSEDDLRKQVRAKDRAVNEFLN